MRDIYHVTLETGDVVLVPRSHLSPKARPTVQEILHIMLSTGDAPVPVPGRQWRVTGAASADCLSMTIDGLHGDDWLPCIWAGLAASSVGGASLWRQMHDVPGLGQTKTDMSRQPPTPWLATRIMPGAGMWPRETAWMADLSECLAIAWLATTGD